MFARLQRDARAIIKSTVEVVYFMRGAIQYDDMMYRTAGERDIIHEFLEERMEKEKDNPYPNY